MKTKLKFIDANDTDGSDMDICHFVYDVIYQGHHEVRIPGSIELQHHVKYLKEYSYNHYKTHGFLQSLKNIFQ